MTFTRGWARATARRWNDYRTDAAMRLQRGSAAFTADVARELMARGATAVISPPLSVGPQKVWRDASFVSHLRLRILSLRLAESKGNTSEVEIVKRPEWDQLAAIDEGAFGREWCTSAVGLKEAMGSAMSSVVMQPRGAERASGYAIAAVSGSTGYLQRIAVSPSGQGRGNGRILLRGAIGWASRRGARHMVLNTKPGNDRAIELYESEGFKLLPDRVELLRYPPPSMPPAT